MTGYQANLNRRKLGLDVLAFVQLRFMVVTDVSTQQFEATVLQHPSVLSCHKITGEADYMLQVVATDLDAYSDFVETVLRKVAGIAMIHSRLAMREIKAVHRFPVPPRK
jgi:Lrp/AsnC family leucine-responsive transcriptional regulator